MYVAGFNVNGIEATPNGKYLIVVQSNTGKVFRIEIATKEVEPIDLGGATVPVGDGILPQAAPRGCKRRGPDLHRRRH